jgi:hypothetical protein
MCKSVPLEVWIEGNSNGVGNSLRVISSCAQEELPVRCNAGHAKPGKHGIIMKGTK